MKINPIRNASIFTVVKCTRVARDGCNYSIMIVEKYSPIFPHHTINVSPSTYTWHTHVNQQSINGKRYGRVHIFYIRNASHIYIVSNTNRQRQRLHDFSAITPFTQKTYTGARHKSVQTCTRAVCRCRLEEMRAWFCTYSSHQPSSRDTNDVKFRHLVCQLSNMSFVCSTVF